MARIDKYEPLTGGHRAQLGFQVAPGDLETPIGVGIDANGRLQKGAATTGVVGVLVLTKIKNPGDIVDVMQDGELVDVSGFTAGSRLFSSTSGVVSTTAGGAPVGFMAEADRMIVRFGRTLGATS